MLTLLGMALVDGKLILLIRGSMLIAQTVEVSGSMATTIISGALLIIGALSAAIVKIIQALNESRINTKQVVEQTKTVVEQNNEQIKQLNRVEILVDGRYGEVLQELSDVRRLLAAQSGTTADSDKADAAQVKATQQAKRVDDSKNV